MQPESIAVLGGGLTGLSAAFYLSRRFPAARITIINEDARFGGCVRSERVKFNYTSPSGTQEEANVVFEAGPRIQRADNSHSVLELIHLLGLTPSTIVLGLSAIANKPFIHVPGSRGIHPIPTSLLGLINPFRAPSAARLGRIFLSSILLERFRRENRPPGIEDESIDAFLTRRFGAEFARVFGSAYSNGTRTADSRELSVRAILPAMWEVEERGRGSVFLGFIRTPKESQSNQDMTEAYELGDTQDKMQKCSVTFKDGMGTLVDALFDYLQKQPNVQMYGGVRVTGLGLDGSENRFKITTSSETLFATHVVSALPLYELDGILSSATPLPHLTANTYSSLTVVNFVFPRPLSTLPEPHPDGFHYYVPRPVNDYSSANGSGILGCLCDPRLTAAQDTTTDNRGIVKMTVLLGGPYYASDPTSPPKVDIPALVSELSFQLDRPLASPLFVRVHTSIESAPVYGVGHLQRMEELKRVLASEPWNGRMEVVGAGVAGVSVRDCVEAGRNVGRNWG